MFLVTWLGVGLIVFMVFLLLSGSGSARKTVALYRSFYSREELKRLAALGSTLAQKALK